MENSTFEPDFDHIALYGAFIRPCCELARAKFGSWSSKKYKPGDICKIWCSKPVSELHKYCDVIKIYTFWPFLFEPGCKHTKKCHDSSDCEVGELNLERLYEIETLEDVTDIVKKFADVPRFINGILKIGTEIDNRNFNIHDALDWMKYADDIGILQKLEKLGNYCWPFLEIFFAEYKLHITRIVLEDYNLIEAFESQNCDSCMKKSESMKKRGNEAFAEEKFDVAVTSYTKAIELWPENHILYGNRALCFLRTGQYKKALCDGKRSIILKPSWPKGHYRFCDALSLLGEHKKALEANERGQVLCQNYPEGIKDLIQQHERLKKQMDEMKGVKQNKHRLKKPLFQKKSSEFASLNTQETKKSDNEKKMLPDNYFCKQKHGKVATNTLTKENKDQVFDYVSGLNENPGRTRSNKIGDSEKLRDHLSSKTDSQQCLDKQKIACSTVRQENSVVFIETLKTLANDGCTSLMDQCFHSAKQSFFQLLNTLDPSNLQYLNLALIDYVVIIYGYATALLGIGQPEELTKAKDHFNNIIEQYEKVRFDCLAYYGIGKVYLRQNRFSEALNQFMKSKMMVSHKIVPGVLTWPTTSIVVEETRIEKFQVMLEDCIEECKFPPNPEAVCRYQQCQAHKVKIYFSDPDFKGFIRVTCCEQCKVEFHISCWKKLKTMQYPDKNDRDFLRELCFTPDCRGLISKIVIFSPSGLIKCEFEHKIKTKNVPRPVVKQKCSSSRNLQKKQERKLRRKFMKEAISLSLRDISEVIHRSNNGAPDTVTREGYFYHQKNFLPGDTVLQLIVQNAEKFETGVKDAFKLLNELLSWWVIGEKDYTLFSTSCVSSNEVMNQLIRFLMDKNNRVKTRVFVHVLSEFEEVDPKLRDWLKHLNNNGLKATKLFFTDYGIYTLELDLDFIAVLWNEKYGMKLGRTFCTSPDMLEILDYLDDLSFMKLRCFIWLLEENREHFPSLHQYLDDYFDNLDNPFTVIRKEETEATSNNAIKVKNRNRKKAKEPKTILVLSGGVGTLPREEDNIFSEESTLSFMDPCEPFRIPDDLNEQVEIFEALYSSSSNSYQRILDNYPDSTCENLYDYFSQILEEHGPMKIDNSLLVGEYEHFPEDTHKIVENAGGLKSFLLQSLRFVMMGDVIGLMKHAVLLKENVGVAGVEEGTGDEESYAASFLSQENSAQSKLPLNPAAKEFKPISYINKPYVSIPTTTEPSSAIDYMTINNSSFSPFLPTYTLTADPTVSSLPMANISIPSVVPEKSPLFLNEISSEYPTKRTFAGITEIPLTPSIEQSNYLYRDLYTIPEEVSECECSFGNLVTSDQLQVFHNSQSVSTKSCILPCENNPDGFDKPTYGAKSGHATKMESEVKSVAKKHPRSRMIAVQVDRELVEVGINTLPLHPYETQQGDMLRMEKEYQVLQEQLKEAREKFEQLKSRSSEEIRVLEDELLPLVEGNKLTKRELDWFHQNVEGETKRWQQEKKENQEALKAGKNKIKKLTETNEIYMRNIDEKDKQYKQCLDEFLEISNKYENEKVKMEELIKKSYDDHQECIKRAVAAEVSVLENWKDAELYKLNRRETNAETNLKYLKFMTSRSSVPQSKLQIDSWESFVSNIKEEIKKAETQFKERICMVKNGAFLHSISKVEIKELQFPTALSGAQERPPINDPAIVMCSTASSHIYPSLFAAVPNSDNKSLLQPTFNMQKENTTSCRSSRAPPVTKDFIEASSDCRGNLFSDNICLPRSPGNSRKHTRTMQPPHNTHEESAAATKLADVKAATKPLHSKQQPENIIDQLRTIFPHYTSSDFENFIAEVKVKNKNKLSTDELLSRVTEFILDHPKKKKVLSSSGKGCKPTLISSGHRGIQIYKESKLPERSMPNPTKSGVASEKTKKPTLSPSSASVPWKTVGGISQSKWKKSSDATDNDPCVICHEELCSEVSHVLDCGHRFHKRCIGPWIKEHSTCPTCRRHVLLPEDYPELPGRNRNT